MGSLKTIFAAMLLGSALMAYQTDAYAQSRNGSSRSSSGSSRTTSVQRPASNTSARKSPTVSERKSSSTGQTAARPSYRSGSASRPSGQSVARPSGNNARPSSGSVSRPSGQSSRPSVGGSSRPSGQSVTRPSGSKVNRPSGTPSRPVDRPVNDYKPGNQNRPIGVTRPGTRPADRPHNGAIHNRPHRPAHPVGVKPPMRPPIYVYPVHVHRPHYVHRPPRPRPGVIIRPYYGTIISHNIAAGMAWTAVRLAYYSSVARTYSQISQNNAYIAEQNATIARNNAVIAAQNRAIAQSDALAQVAYDKAQRLGLVQSYAAANMEYYYQNGVFYVLDADGEYRVIVPPAGAIVDSLPDDMTTVTLGGEVFYRVDNTIYQTRNIDGKLCFEVLGQLAD